MRNLLNQAEMLALSTLRLEQTVTIIGPDYDGRSERVGQRGVIAFIGAGDWLVAFDERQTAWYATESLKAVEL